MNGFVHIGRFIKYMYSRTCPVIFWVKLAWVVERFIEKAEVNSQDNKQLGLTDKLKKIVNMVNFGQKNLKVFLISPSPATF